MDCAAPCRGGHDHHLRGAQGARNTLSEELYARARRVTPGGVHSPVRAFGRVGGTPFFVRRASGAFLEDTEGRRYLDFCMAFGPLIFGHADPGIVEEIRGALAGGWSYGTAEPYSLELAEFIVARVPWVESIRFVNSGTEAVMSALRVARAATGRNRMLKFAGCYHGHADGVLIRAGSGLAGTPDSAGVSAAVAAETLVGTLDDISALEEIFARSGHELAAAIIEPLPANCALLPQQPEFLTRLRELCTQHGALLIFDEVISGFRVAFGGCAELYGVLPDLVTYGKILGGGFPVGAFGGRRRLMELVAPSGPVYQAGTLSANPVAMRAGLASLQRLADGSVYRELERLGRLLGTAVHEAGCGIVRVGSIFWLTADTAGRTMRRPEDIPAVAIDGYPRLFHGLLAAGIYLPPSVYEVGFLSTAHTDADILQLGHALGGVGKS